MVRQLAMPSRPHAGEGGGIVLCVVAVAGVLHDDGAGAGQVVSAEGRRAVGAQPRRHPCPRRAAPEGVALQVHLEFLGVVRDEGDGRGQILAGGLGSGAVEEGKGIVPPRRESSRAWGKLSCMAPT